MRDFGVLRAPTLPPPLRAAAAVAIN
jgi:hypothetical protein